MDNSAIITLIYHESLITKNTFEPFIINYINNNYNNSKKQLKITDFVNLSLHHKYITEESIKNIVDFTNLKNNLEDNVDLVKKCIQLYIK